jgi:hypothetical protein
MARKPKTPIVLGKSYTFTFPGGEFGRGQIDYTVVAEETTETVRFKKKVEGYRLLILDTRGDNPWAKDGVTVGSTVTVPKEGAILRYGLKELA